MKLKKLLAYISIADKIQLTEENGETMEMTAFEVYGYPSLLQSTVLNISVSPFAVLVVKIKP